MRKFCVGLAAVIALVLGGWAGYGANGPPDLAAVSDREAAEASGGGPTVVCTPGCYYVSFVSGCDYTVGYPKVGGYDYCPYAPDYFLNGGCGGTANVTSGACTNACGNTCGDSTMTVAWTTCGPNPN